MPNAPDPTESAPAAHGFWVGIGDALHAKIAPRLADAKHEHVAGILEAIEADLVPALAPFVAHIADDPNMPPELRDLVRTLIEPEHFGQSIILGIALGAILAPVLQGATAPFVQDLANFAWSGKSVLPLSPAEIALGQIRHNPHIANPYLEASYSGISDKRLDAMIYNTGDSPAIGDLLLLYRRKLIDLARLNVGIQQSRVRDEWAGSIVDLRFAPPSIGEILAGRVKSHLDDAQATELFEEAGIDPKHYTWMRDTAGRPPGIEQMLHLRNRNLATDQDVLDAIAQSDIAPRFAPFIPELRWYIPPVRSIMPMLRAGVVTDTEAATMLAEQGVRPVDIPRYIAEGHHTRASAVKTLTESQVVKAYTLRRIDAPTAEARIVALGYDAADAQLFIDLADELRIERLADALTSKIRSLYTAWKMTKTNAVSALTQGGITTLEQADLFHIWDLERTANVHHVTPAQIVGAYRRGEITALECKTRLLNGGVQAGDIGIVVADGWPVGKPGAAQTAAAAVIGA